MLICRKNSCLATSAAFRCRCLRLVVKWSLTPILTLDCEKSIKLLEVNRPIRAEERWMIHSKVLEAKDSAFRKTETSELEARKTLRSKRKAGKRDREESGVSTEEARENFACYPSRGPAYLGQSFLKVLFMVN